MDEETIQLYERKAAQICPFMEAISEDERGYPARIREFFYPGQPTADIGCGSGRDVAWLNEHGYPTVGYDASPAMLAQAQAAYPGIDLRRGCLPGLTEIPDKSFANVQCVAAVMHLARQDLACAVSNLARILRPQGRLLINFRHSRSEGEREPDGRLFTRIDPQELALLLESVGFRVVASTAQQETRRPDVRWYTILAEKER